MVLPPSSWNTFIPVAALAKVLNSKHKERANKLITYSSHSLPVHRLKNNVPIGIFSLYSGTILVKEIDFDTKYLAPPNKQIGHHATWNTGTFQVKELGNESEDGDHEDSDDKSSEEAKKVVKKRKKKSKKEDKGTRKKPRT